MPIGTCCRVQLVARFLKRIPPRPQPSQALHISGGDELVPDHLRRAKHWLVHRVSSRSHCIGQMRVQIPTIKKINALEDGCMAHSTSGLTTENLYHYFDHIWSVYLGPFRAHCCLSLQLVYSLRAYSRLRELAATLAGQERGFCWIIAQHSYSRGNSWRISYRREPCD